MSVTSVGSSFAYVRPETAVRATASTAEASDASAADRARAPSEAASSGAGEGAARQAPPSRGAEPAALARVQESERQPPSPRAATRAYSGG